MSKSETRTLTLAEWEAEGERRFGKDKREWAFVCPVCGHVATALDWKAVGAPEGSVAFSCVGRWMDKPRDAFAKKGEGPCNYAGGGLFRLNPVIVTDPGGKEHALFDFAPAGQ